MQRICQMASMFIKFSWRQVFTTLIFLNDLLLSNIFLSYFFLFFCCSRCSHTLYRVLLVRFIFFFLIFFLLLGRSCYYYIFRFFFFKLGFLSFFALEFFASAVCVWHYERNEEYKWATFNSFIEFVAQLCEFFFSLYASKRERKKKIVCAYNPVKRPIGDPFDIELSTYVRFARETVPQTGDYFFPSIPLYEENSLTFDNIEKIKE